MVNCHIAGPKSVQEAQKRVLQGDTSLLFWMLMKLLVICVREVVLLFWRTGKRWSFPVSLKKAVIDLLNLVVLGWLK